MSGVSSGGMVRNGKTYHQQQDKQFADRSFLPCNRILEDPHIKVYLTEIQSKYILVPADKAGINIIFVCKYYYIHWRSLA